MPYRDPEKRRAYNREHQRLRRAGKEESPLHLELPVQFRLESAKHVMELLEEQVNAVRADPSCSTLERARCIGSLAGIILRAIQAGEMEARLQALETVLKGRGKPL